MLQNMNNAPLIFAEETLANVVEDPAREALWAEHYNSISSSYEATLRVNVDICSLQVRESAGQLVVVTARRAGVLQGYCAMLITPSDFFNQQTLAFDHAYFLAPAARGGRNAQRFVEAILRACAGRGVTRAYITTKQLQPMSRLLAFLGWNQVDSIWAYTLKGSMQ